MLPMLVSCGVTKRQGEVLSLAARGLTDKEIAERLSLSVSTIRTHLVRFYETNDLRNKTEAVAAWLRHNKGKGK